MRVLIVEDHVKMAALIQRGLRKEAMAVDVTGNGEDALWMAEATHYDAIVLDVMLPGLDGFEVCRRLREEGVWAPILMLTARDAVRDRVSGLDSGADDYLTKPFSTQELLARIRALLRRKAPQALDAAVEVNGLKLDPATRRVTRAADGAPREVKVGPTEFRLLHFFMTHPERVHSRAQLLDRVWGDHVFIEERTVDVHVKRLREALAVVGCAAMIETVRGAGYRLAQATALSV
jgi:two-component system phosphate regulon response regulator PhoB